MSKRRLFVDMDGTIARFHDEANYLERMFEKGFFENLEPFDMAICGLKQFHKDYPDVEIYIISSTVDGYPPYCEDEKNKWLDKWMPFIDKEHRLFPKIGQEKAELVPDGVTIDDYLYDDYNKNLVEWVQAGGNSIKCHNNINNKGRVGKRWVGDILSNYNADAILLDDRAEMKEALKEYNDIMYEIDGEYHSIGTSFSESYTVEWSLRDMVSELSYVLSTYYEEGHANQLMQHSADEDERKEWIKETNMIETFIAGHIRESKAMVCASNHSSKFDNAEIGYKFFSGMLAYLMHIDRMPNLEKDNVDKMLEDADTDYDEEMEV